MISADMELLSGEPEDVIARVSETADTRRTKFDGSEIVWRIWGQGEPIVLLHGGYGSWTHWIRNVGALARAYRVIVPDMPGYGESDFPAGLKTMNDFAKVLADGLAELLPQREPYRLVGFSFGSAVASHLLPFEHARIRRLVIVGTSGLGRRTVVSGNMRRWRDLATRE